MIHITATGNTPQARGERLKRLRNLANLSRKELCDESDLNLFTLKGWEIGRYGGLTRKGAEKIIPLLTHYGVVTTIEWLLDGDGPAPIVNAETIQQSVKPAGTLIDQELLFFKQHYPTAVGFIVEDDGMLPQYRKGDYVAGINRHGKDIDSLENEACIVQLEAGEILFRQLRLGSAEGLYTLFCINIHSNISQPILYDIKLKCAAPVIWHRKRDPLLEH